MPNKNVPDEGVNLTTSEFKAKLENLRENPVYENILTQLDKDEFVRCLLPENAVFKRPPVLADNSVSQVDESTAGVNWYDNLHAFIIRHNIRVMSKWYTQIRMARLAYLLGLSESKAEEYLAAMVTAPDAEKLLVKIDRIDGIVNFTPEENVNSYLTRKFGDVTNVLGMLDNVCHLIAVESMRNENPHAGIVE